jgi:hypothetical protein
MAAGNLAFNKNGNTYHSGCFEVYNKLYQEYYASVLLNI